MSETSITRRRFVGAAVATGAGAALPASALAETGKKPKAKRDGKTRTADVCVVGAGFAGLTAARKVARAGHSVVLLEARTRVGGRAWNLHLPHGVIAERGATFAGPTQGHILGMAKAMKVKTFPSYDDGNIVYINGSKRLEFPDAGVLGNAPPDPVIIPDLATTVAKIDAMAKTIDVNAPWEAAKAAEWDSQTLATWFDANSVTEDFKELTPLILRPAFGAEARELSLLFTVFYAAASGDEKHPGTFERNFNTHGGAQELRFEGGTQLIAQRMAKQLGHRVVLGSPVRRISQSAKRVRVDSDKLTVNAKRVIVAIPPALAGRIDYHPILPYQRDQLTQRMAQAVLVKVTVVYDRPFWRDQGRAGQLYQPKGLVSATFDDSPPEGKPGILLGFIGADQARRYLRMSPAAGRAAVLKELAGGFGAAALKPRSFHDTRWTGEQWTRGCPVGIPSMGTLLEYGPWLRKPVRRIHWAGTETSTYWNGYMDGAVRSGERAAGEVLARI